MPLIVQYHLLFLAFVFANRISIYGIIGFHRHSRMLLYAHRPFYERYNTRAAIALDVKNAVWGGLMTAGALARGALGVIISGRCRDIAEHRSVQFPVFARGHSTLGQSPFTRPSAINVPLIIHPQGDSSAKDAFPPLTVRPGDWMVADEDGVVCVPLDMEDQVVELAALGRDVDSKCMEDIKAGVGIQASFKKHRGK
jgi:regulator of RNase E activity RraA